MADTCPTCGNEYANLSVHLNTYYPDHKPSDWNECPHCSERYNSLSQHWRQSDCEYPKLTQEQKEIVTGILMGDGSIKRRTKDSHESYFVVSMINDSYLSYVDEKLDYLSSGVDVSRSKDGKDYLYVLQTVTHPHFTKLREWYSSGEKQYPYEIELTPTVLKHWYVCDGHIDEDKYRSLASITMCNEEGNEDKIDGWMNSIGINDYSWVGGSKTEIRFGVEGTREFFDYIGDPVEGFKYKWPEDRV